MTPLRRLLIVLILLASALGIASGASAAADRNVIRIRGRVVDRAGNGLPGAWVVTLGSRRTGTIVASDGSYSLSVPGATLAEIERVPLNLRVQARRKDWRIELPGGDPELGIELRVASDSSGAWLQVRSNDAAVAQMLANAAVLESGTRVELMIDFVGVRGTPATEEVPLARLEEVRLSGVMRTAPEPAGRVATKVAESVPEPERSKVPPPPPAMASRAAHAESTARPMPSETVARPAPSETPVRLVPSEAVARPIPVEDTTRAIAMPPLRETPLVQAPPRAPLVPVETRPEVENSLARSKKVAKPRVVRPALTTGDDPLESEESPRVVRPGAPEEAAREEAERAKKKPHARAATEEEVRHLLEAKPELGHEASPTTVPREAPPADASGSTRDASGASPVSGMTNPARPSVPNGGGNGKPGPTARPVSPSEAMGSPALAAPLKAVPPAVPIAPPSGGIPFSGEGPCICRIQGTIEINAGDPLPERMQVVVSLEDDGKVKDTVELFMGSPREFELLGVSCKPHRLRFKTKSKQKFMLVSDEPVVDCTGGGFRQIRLLLEPMSRWRVSK